MSRYRTSVASYTVLVLLAGGLTAFAVQAEGYPVHKADLNDGGIWVTDQAIGQIGRENKPVGQLDGILYARSAAQSTPVDVLQSGAAVVAVDEGSQTLTPVDVTAAHGLDDRKVSMPGAGQVAIGGDVLAVVDSDTGKLWAAPVDDEAGVISLSTVDSQTKPLTKVGGRAAVAVAQDGTVFAASGATRRLTTVRPTKSGFAKPTASPLGGKPQGSLRVSAVGDQPAVLDSGGLLELPNGRSVQVGRGAVLQQPGPAADSVLVATDGELLAVSIDSGVSTHLAKASGAPAQPVRIGDCALAAWGGGTQATVVTACGGQDPQLATFPTRGSDLVFRVNRGQVLLNDVSSGDVWNIDSDKPVQIANWPAFNRKPEPGHHENNPTQGQAAENTKVPTAKADELGARPDRTTVLHVLDNDSAPAGSILSITGVGPTGDPGAQVAVAPDHESVLLTLSGGATADTSFQYFINDGRPTGNAKGSVVVHTRTDSAAAPPTLRDNYVKPTLTVPSGGSMTIGTLSDWRDQIYGDPVVLSSASAAAGRAAITPEGVIRFDAPVAGGPVAVTYAVSAGGGAPVSRTLTVNVQNKDAKNAIPAQSEPDVAAGEVGGTVTIRPLDNDIPGSDPTDRQAQLALAGPVSVKTGGAGLLVSTDLQSGIVTVNAQRAGTYLLAYSAAFGAARPDAQEIRVDIANASKRDVNPLATPDTTVVRGQSPVTVDVLANDYDPKGGLLVVQQAAAAANTSVQVAVVDGRWLRVSASAGEMHPNPAVVHYQISNGEASANGTLTITQRPHLADNSPVTQRDNATVRAGDSVAIPVLDNDSTPAGDPITLLTDPAGSPHAGQLKVTPPIGTAYVSGRLVRYVAPATITGPQQVEIEYVAANVNDSTADPQIGTAVVSITTPPTKANPDRAPTAREIDGRVVSGDAITLKVPSVGSDPDGDSVTVTGIAVSGGSSAPHLGRILSYGATSLVYQSFPGSRGTDEFRYSVTDTYGRTAEGGIRVGVVPPGAPQAPVAVDDHVYAAPGRSVTVDALANDFRIPGTRLRIRPVTNAPHGVHLMSDSGPFKITAKQENNADVTVPYTVTNGLDSSNGQIIVTTVTGFNNPPIAFDAYAHPKPGNTDTTIDVLAKDYDPDGSIANLTLESVSGAATISGGKVTVVLKDVPRVLTYRLVDSDGGAASASIYVPGQPKGAPGLRANARIRLAPGQTKQIPVSSLVVDPEGQTVRLTQQDRIWAAPEQQLTVNPPPNAITLSVTASKHTGPASLTFEVTDGAKVSDTGAHTVVLTVPVQVGTDVPVINCPDDPLEVHEGGMSSVVDVASVCHVWTDNPADAQSLLFTSRWQGQPQGVDVANTDAGIKLTAGISAVPGKVGTLAVAAKGSTEATGLLHVVVVKVAPPTMRPITLKTYAGKPVSTDVAGYVSSQLRDPRYAVVQVDGPGTVTSAHAGTRVTLTPHPGVHGVLQLVVAVTDVAGTGRKDRLPARGPVQLNVIDKPDQPTALRPGADVLSRTVQLTWTKPSNNGAPIDHYEVDFGGRHQDCAGTTCRVIGLTNGQQYRFTVRAHNEAGWGLVSGAVSATPDALPGPIVGLHVVHRRDGQIFVAWAQPTHNEGSKVTSYDVSVAGHGVETVPGLSFTAGGLTDGENVAISVTPYNKLGPGPKTLITDMAAGRPDAPAAPAVHPTNSADRSTKAVTVSWPALLPKGPGPTTYMVTRTGGGAAKQVCSQWTPNPSCVDDGVANDGTTYQYAVQARNAEETPDPGYHESGASGSTSLEAAAPPDPVTINDLQATGNNGSATVTFDVGPSHGAQNIVHCTVRGGSCGDWNYPTAGQASDTKTIGGMNNGETSTLRLQSCNGSSGGADTGDNCSGTVERTVVTYGPIGQPTLNVAKAGQYSPNINWSFNVDPNGKAVTVRLTRNGATVWGPQSMGPGSASASGTDGIGNSQTGSYVLTVSDAGRGTKTATASATTDPPQPQVIVSRGTPCGGGGGAPCRGAGGPCTSSSCAYVHLHTVNFPRNPDCKFNSQHGDGGWGNTISWGANADADTIYWYGFPSTWVQVTCDGIASAQAPW